jgi:NAD(P)-dependent dehydrogenase (short-subunit alcohol dehydrogenase family)
MKLNGNVALVTGGAGGLGSATARHLHSRGARIVLFDRDERGVVAIADSLGEGCVAVTGDAGSDQDMREAVDAASALGTLRMVVACAGGATASARTVQRDGSPHDLTLFIETLNLNAVTTFNTLRIAAAKISAAVPVDDDGERGVIVTTASIAAFEGQIGQIAYGSAKGAITAMTLIAARDLADFGIRVNCIAPGTIGTAAWDAAPAKLRESLEAKVPFPRRLGHPTEFADLAEHLIVNRYLNGHVVRLDGAIRFDPR